MNKITTLFLMLLIGSIGFSQQQQQNLSTNSGETLLNSLQSKGFTLGGYGQIDYNEPDGSAPGNIDVHRLVLLFAYKFNDKVSFLTEVEFEHVKEVYVEQAYLRYQMTPGVNFVAGLMLVPMGIINEYHEPTTFYGTERPNVDKYIVPTTWRELGLGLNGTLPNVSLKYQAYLFNGFKSYQDGEGVLRGSDGLRKGRQKGAESFVNSANFSAKIDWYGLPGLRLGLSGYFGETQTDDSAVVGSTVGVSMIGLDARYQHKKLQLRGQYIYTDLKDTEEYNALTGKDLGSRMDGYYAEAAYSFPIGAVESLTPFVRYESYNTHAGVEGDLIANDAFDRNEWIFGLNWKVAQGAAFKIDYQIKNTAVPGASSSNTFNAGVGAWF